MSQVLEQARGVTRSVVSTTSHGAPVDSITASLSTAGDLLLKDTVFIDHMARFDRERIPERVVHAKGAGAFGVFEVTNDITKYTKAAVFSKVGKKTPLAVRFSTVGGESGSADTARDPRGFAVKMYTEEGNWDLVGNNTPIFFIRDPILFPSFIHTQKRNPATHLKDADMMWDFISLRPETTHQVSFLFSDRGIPDGYRFMHGFGSHTFKLVNDKNVPVFCKFHWKCDQGIKNLSPDVAGKLAGDDPDYAIRDLYNAIHRGEFPSWTLKIQVMTVEQAKRASFNPFDVTKTWPQAEYPLIEVGKMTLNRNPANYFAEVEQIAFSPSHMVPGIEASQDKMLQGRLFSYPDTHRHRLGVNYQQIPVNCPYASRVANYQRDGPAVVNGNQGGAPNYFPNSFSGPQPTQSAAITADVAGVKGGSRNESNLRIDTGDEDNFSQVGIFWRKVLDEPARKRLVDNIAGNLKDAQQFIQDRAISNFSKADPDYGRRIKERIAQYKKSKL